MMEEIMKKYILNFDNNFITGNYERDYSTWSSSFTSLYNQVISMFEAGVAVNLIKKTGETFLNTAVEGVKLPFKIASYISKEYNRPSYRQLKLPYRYFERKIGSSLKNVVKQSTILTMSTVFRDKVYATIALFGIGLKKAIEEFFPVNIISPVEHEVTDEQLNEIIRVFELLQNEYLMDSDIEPRSDGSQTSLSRAPIKVGNEWQNEEIQIPPIEELEKELTDIVVMNKQYIEKRYELAEQPVVETISQEQSEPEFLNEIDDELQTMIKELEGLEDTTYLNEIDNELETIMNELDISQTVLNTQDVLNEEENIEEE
jgi:hypothetical protein